MQKRSTLDLICAALAHNRVGHWHSVAAVLASVTSGNSIDCPSGDAPAPETTNPDDTVRLEADGLGKASDDL